MKKAYWLVFVDHTSQLLTVQLHAELAQGPHKAAVTYMERDLTDNHIVLQHRVADDVCLVANLEPPAAAQLHCAMVIGQHAATLCRPLAESGCGSFPHRASPGHFHPCVGVCPERVPPL